MSPSAILKRNLASERTSKLAKLEVPAGFEPANIGFADRPLGPLGHGTPLEIFNPKQGLGR